MKVKGSANLTGKAASSKEGASGLGGGGGGGGGGELDWRRSLVTAEDPHEGLNPGDHDIRMYYTSILVYEYANIRMYEYTDLLVY